VKLFFDVLQTYELFDHDSSTSLTHFVNFAGSYGINDLESRLQVILGR